MSVLKNKLNRYKKHIKPARDQVEAASGNLEQHNFTNEIPFLEEWKSLNVRPFYFDGHYSMIREVTYPLNHQHGLYKFFELFDVAKAWKDSNNNHPLSCNGITINDMVFFDTETTGLGGGVGNTIFMIGYARVYSDRVVATQHFLPNPGEEVPLYQAFLADIGESRKLLSYNGKAFDWPQVKTRHTLIRDLVPKLPSFGHFDLLHASRRMWKNDLPSVRLSVVEKEILEVKRSGDVPGYLAPMLYFDFLKDPNPKGLKGVFYHNEVDVLTLITLYIHLSKHLLNKIEAATSNELLEVARWFEYVGEFETALRFYKQVDRKKSLHAQALIFKKKKDYDQSIKLWEQAGNTYGFDEVMLTELAKVYEHQIKELDKAYFYAKKANDLSQGNRKIEKSHIEGKEHLKRLERLQNKMKRKK